MPRKIKQKPQPIESIPLNSNTEIQVWNNPADEGGRGSESKRKRGDAFNLILGELQKKLTEQNMAPARLTLTLKDLLGDRTVDTVARKYVSPTLKKQGITLSATTEWEIAKDICDTFKALEMAVKNNSGQLQPLEKYSPEYFTRQELEKGTFRRKL